MRRFGSMQSGTVDSTSPNPRQMSMVKTRVKTARIQDCYPRHDIYSDLEVRIIKTFWEQCSWSLRMYSGLTPSHHSTEDSFLGSLPKRRPTLTTSIKDSTQGR